MDKNRIRKIVFAALFLAAGMVLPLLTAQVKEIGDSLLPMHLVVMLCGLICGWKYGLAVGFILPFLRSLIFTMPPMYPNAVWMALELATYGAVIGFIWSRFGQEKISRLYVALIVSMISGRIVWGIVKALLLGIGGKLFGFAAFITGGFVDAIPGIVIQLILIPVIMSLIKMAQKKA